MTSRAYIKLLDNARCTVNFSAGNIFDGSKPMTYHQRVEFIMDRLARFRVKGYSKEYVSQLIKEDMITAKG